MKRAEKPGNWYDPAKPGQCAIWVPLKGRDGFTERVKVPCGACSACWFRSTEEWQARALCELATSSAAHLLTLTYADRGPNVHPGFLPYGDFQKCVRKLRDAGFPARYIVVGEHGKLKGRGHWHAILFWQGEVPELPKLDASMQHWDYWPHGFTHVRAFDPEAVRYVLKYARKDLKGNNTGNVRFRTSLKPPIGDAFIADLARQYARNRLFPEPLTFEPPGAPIEASRAHQLALYAFSKGERGALERLLRLKRKTSHINGTLRRNFCRAWLAEFAERFGDDAHLPKARHLQEYLASDEWQDAVSGVDQITAAMRAAWRKHKLEPQLKRGVVTRCNRAVVYADTAGDLWLYRARQSGAAAVQALIDLQKSGASQELQQAARADLFADQTMKLPRGDFGLLRKALAGRWAFTFELGRRRNSLRLPGTTATLLQAEGAQPGGSDPAK